MPSKDSSIIVVGAGVFGLTLALELSVRGFKNITILDRHLPPVPDGSSVDISRVIRSEYGDVIYNRMAIEAIQGWKTDYPDLYHECGMCILSWSGANEYRTAAQAISREQGATLKEFEDGQSVRQTYPFFYGDFSNTSGYTNPAAGWADSAGTISRLARRCSDRGISFITGRNGTVVSLKSEAGRATGVNVLSGTTIPADIVVLGTGAWTSQLLDISSVAIGTVRGVGYIQLSPEEAAKLANMPVVLNIDTGFFVFPPTPDTNILKFARHGYGFETRIPAPLKGDRSRCVSSPRRDHDGSTSSFMPTEEEECFREGLRTLFEPSISERPFCKTRMCWYTDTPKNDWIVGYHNEGLFLATGGSGHAFKFLPVLGKYTADVFEGRASEELCQKWSLNVDNKDLLMRGDGSRGGPPRRVLSAREQAKL